MWLIRYLAFPPAWGFCHLPSTVSTEVLIKFSGSLIQFVLLSREPGSLRYFAFACTVLGNRQCCCGSGLLGIRRGHRLLLYECVEYWVFPISKF